MYKHKWIFPVGMIVVLVVIFIASSQTYEQQDMRPLLGELLNTPYLIDKLSFIDFVYAGKEISVEEVGVAGLIEFFIRKSAHFIVFCLLGFFTYGVWHLMIQKGRNWSFLFSLLFVIIYACLDELHQKMTGGRSPLVQDVMIDTIGGLCGIILCMSLLFLINRRKGKIT